VYEDALELVYSRDTDIQNDKEILQALSSDSTLSIPESWEKIVHIQNGSIRYAACRCFLNNCFGENKVDYVGDLRVVFSLFDTTIILPGSENMTKPQVMVKFNSLPKLLEHPNKDGEAMDSAEREAEQYAALLRRQGSALERVKMRVPVRSKLWSDLTCRLYYFFSLYPSDVIHGRSDVEYWEALKEREQAKRKDKDRVNWMDWNTQRKTAQFFKEEIYPKLKLFDMPIFIQNDQQTISVEKFFSLVFN